MGKPVVWTWEPNSNSGKPLFALKQKGVDFEFHYTSMLDFEHHTPKYLARNPAGTLPTMEHDGKILTESTPIIEYIDAAWPDQGPHYVPVDPKARHQMRYWGRRIVSYSGALSSLGWSRMGSNRRSPDEIEKIVARIPTKERQIAWRTAMTASFTEEQLARARAAVGECVMLMEQRLAEHPWLAGPDYTVADLECFANFYALPMTVPEVANRQKAPRYCDWLLRIYNMPGTMEAFALSRLPGQRAVKVKADLEA
jgi:glutathione S-transferase/GST-like protein